MKKLWRNSFIWFIILFLNFYFLLVLLEKRLYLTESLEFNLWSKKIIITAFILALIPFFSKLFLGDNRIIKLLFNSQKTLKIISISSLTIMLIWFFLWYSMLLIGKKMNNYCKKEEALKIARIYLHNNQNLNDSIGIINSIEEISSKINCKKDAIFSFEVHGSKDTITVDVQLNFENDWHANLLIFK